MSETSAVLRSLFLPAYLPTILYALGSGAITPVVILAGLDLGLGHATAALLVTFFGLSAAAGSGPAGMVVQRAGERGTMVVASAVAIGSAALVLLALTVRAPWSVPVFVAAILIQALAQVVFGIARQALVAEATPAFARARAISAFGASQRVGRLLGPLVGAALIAVWDVRGGYLAALIAFAIATVVMLAVRAPSPTPLAARSSPGTVAASEKVDVGLVAQVLVGVLLLVIARGNRDVLVPLWGEQLGLAPATISLLYAAAVAVELTLFLPAGAVMDRFGRVWVAAPCCAVMAIGFAVMAGSGPVWYIAGTLLVSVGNGLGSGIVQTLGADLSPPGRRATFLGWWSGLAQTGIAVGPAIVAATVTIGSLALGTMATAGAALAGALWFTSLRIRSRLR